MDVYCLEFAGEDDDFAAYEAASAAAGVEPIAPGLAIAGAIERDRVRGLAYTRRASELLGRTDADLASARACLAAADLDPDAGETVAVRAVDVRGSTSVSTGEAERVLGQVLVDRGFGVDLEDPDRVLRVAFSAGRIEGSTLDVPGSSSATDPGSATDPDDPLDGAPDEPVSVCTIGWLEVESVRDFQARKPTEKPFFQPGSMDPLLARAIANVAGARQGATLLDPMCGTGGVLVEAGLVGANVLGTDAQAKMVRGARENLTHYLDTDVSTADGDDTGKDGPDTTEDGDDEASSDEIGDWYLARADATRLPLADDAADAVVFDAPYGRQSKIETHRLEDLVAGALTEARRVAPRAIVVADRLWVDAIRDVGWTIEAAFERRVHRSLTRYVLVLER